MTPMAKFATLSMLLITALLVAGCAGKQHEVEICESRGDHIRYQQEITPEGGTIMCGWRNDRLDERTG